MEQEEREVKPTPIVKEVALTFLKDPLWTMYFDGACSKEGLGARVIFISP